MEARLIDLDNAFISTANGAFYDLIMREDKIFLVILYIVYNYIPLCGLLIDIIAVGLITVYITLKSLILYNFSYFLPFAIG